MNPALRHLEEPLRIGMFTVGQLIGLVVSGLIAICFGYYLSPFSDPKVTVGISIYIGALPAMAIFIASTSDFDALRLVKGFYRFQREAGAFLAGPGEVSDGYVVLEEERPKNATSRNEAAEEAALITEALWQE